MSLVRENACQAVLTRGGWLPSFGPRQDAVLRISEQGSGLHLSMRRTTSSAIWLRQSFGTFDQWMFDDSGSEGAGRFDGRPLRWPIVLVGINHHVAV